MRMAYFLEIDIGDEGLGEDILPLAELLGVGEVG